MLALATPEVEGTEAASAGRLAGESSDAEAAGPESMAVALEACMGGPEAPGGETLATGAEDSTVVQAA